MSVQGATGSSTVLAVEWDRSRHSRAVPMVWGRLRIRWNQHRMPLKRQPLDIASRAAGAQTWGRPMLGSTEENVAGTGAGGVISWNSVAWWSAALEDCPWATLWSSSHSTRRIKLRSARRRATLPLGCPSVVTLWKPVNPVGNPWVAHG